ncbi:GDP-D-glucose phosphorylase 1 [Acropora cervicornis]|uniref:GDP-D-glucose phosphorylase 1 n=1 Tax=Acropora cervicornis TaxID=6130 RepID=A0AAD9R6N6_ACRCE|nr:GDP-D-glucose phosphorylase 1 [Acropora cervicornis]
MKNVRVKNSNLVSLALKDGGRGSKKQRRDPRNKEIEVNELSQMSNAIAENLRDCGYDSTSTTRDFHWKWTGGEQNKLELSEFDVKLQDRWNAAVDAGCFAYKLDDIEARIVPGKYQVFVQLNEMRFNKRRQPQRMSSVSQPFNPENFNFTKVQSKEVLLELCPEQRLSLGDHHLIIINNSPLEFGHSLIIPSVNSCLPQVGFHVGFNSLCAQASVNHLHFHTWYSEYSSYLETADMIPICEDLFEVIDYPTTIFVFELAPESSVSSIAKKIHLASTYLTKNEVAHNLHIMRGRRCLSHSHMNGYMQQDDKNSVLRVFLWPRNSVLGAKDLSSYESEKRPIAVYELAGSLAIESKASYNCSRQRSKFLSLVVKWQFHEYPRLHFQARPTYDSFTEEHFCGYLKRATLPEEEFTLHKNSIRVLLMKNQI